jgi:predicted deacylase
LIDAVRFDGPEPGPRLLFLGGVHGEEKPGILALDKLMKELREGRVKLLRGALTVVARVNAKAVELGRHCVDENLNRIVRLHAEPATHEQALANELTVLIDAADAVLDLHGTPAPTTPFAFLDDESPENRAWAAALGLDVLLLGWPALYAGGKTVTTTEYAQSRGKRALTIEVGQNDDTASARIGFAFALRSLVHFGLTTPVSPPGPARELRFTRVFYREREGAFARAWKNFDPVKKGEVLARYADGAEVLAPEDAVVVMPYDATKVGEEWFYLAVPA